MMSREGTIDPAQLKIINPQHHKNFPLLCSTRLYPEWAFAVMPQVEEKYAWAVTSLLIGLTPSTPAAKAAGIYGFTIPADYSPVESMMRDLQIPPFDTHSPITPIKIWEQYRWQIHTLTGMGLLICCLVIWLFTTRRNLKQARNRLQALFNALPDAIYLHEIPSGRIIGCNSAAPRMLKRTEAEICTLTVADIDLDFSPQRDALIWEDLMVSGHHTLEGRHLRSDGSTFPVEVNVTLSTGEKTPFVLAIVRDITHRKEGEEELKKSEERFKALAEASFGGIIIHDHGHIIECNTALSGMTGYNRQELLSMNGLTLFAPESLSTVEANIKSGFVQRYEVTGLRKDGTRYPLVIRGRNISYLGRDVRVIELRDITELKQTEIALREERQRLAHIIQGTNVGTWEWNVQTGEIILNERWADIIGYTLAEISPLSIKTLMKHAHPDDLAASKSRLQDHFSGASNYYVSESRMQHKDGHWVWVLDRGQVVEWTEDGRPLRMAGTHQDVTLRKQVEENLRSATAAAKNAEIAKSNFLANMSHEIRTPLNGMLGMLEILKGTNTTPEQAEYLNDATTCGWSLLHLLNEILDLSKIEAGQMELHNTSVVLDDIETSVRSTFFPLLRNSIVQLKILRRVEVPDCVWADETRIRQILFNLVGNAVKFTERGAVTLTIGCNASDDPDKLRLLFVVEDTGIGIPECFASVGNGLSDRLS